MIHSCYFFFCLLSLLRKIHIIKLLIFTIKYYLYIHIYISQQFHQITVMAFFQTAYIYIFVYVILCVKNNILLLIIILFTIQSNNDIYLNYYFLLVWKPKIMPENGELADERPLLTKYDPNFLSSLRYFVVQLQRHGLIMT